MVCGFNFYNCLTGGGGQNKQHVTTKNTAKLDRETEELKHNKVPLDLGKLIQQGRQAKGWSQKDLATVSSPYCCGQDFINFMLFLSFPLQCILPYFPFLFLNID